LIAGCVDDPVLRPSTRGCSDEIQTWEEAMKKFATIVIAVLACATGGFAANAKDVTVSGCARADVVGCGTDS
jgi:1-aminocyclopropane-1-carboxylate deaminase/D-cysteine desulfhydrase-like pyridoxal-dependent ACC family enzyme